MVIRRYGPRGLANRQFKQKLHECQQRRSRPEGYYAPVVVPTVNARTVFVWPRMGMNCGIAEYVKHMVAASQNAAACQRTNEIVHAEHVVLVLMPSLEEPIGELISFIRRVRSEGTRVTLDVHHMTVGQNPFGALLSEVNDAVWRQPRMPGLAGGGRFLPLPVPALPRPDAPHIGGLVHFGLGHVSKRLPVMAQVAAALGTQLHVYGERNREHVPAHLAQHVNVFEAFLPEHDLCRALRQHDVGLIGRARWSPHLQLNGSASARFLIGVGVPAVIDRAEAHEDLEGVLDVVPFDDVSQVIERVRLLTENPDYRAEALERARQYAEQNSPRRIAEQMGIAT